MIKLVYCLRKRDDIDPDRFYRYWLEEHGPLVKSVAAAIGASRYVQSHTILPELNELMIESRDLKAPYDGVTEVWWETMSALEQGTMLFDILGMEPKFVKVPIEVMDGVIKILDAFAGSFANMRDAAEFGKIGRYYAAESMLVLDATTGEYDASKTPSYGTDTLEAFFKKVSVEGLAGQELGDQAVFK